MTRQEWADNFLAGLNAPATKRNRVTMIVWIASEGGAARNNPLNSTKAVEGSTDYNTIPVQNYPSESAGLLAELATIKEHGKGYEAIIDRLRRNRHSWWTLRAVYASKWGTVKIPYMLLSVHRAYDFYASQPVAG